MGDWGVIAFRRWAFWPHNTREIEACLRGSAAIADAPIPEPRALPVAFREAKESYALRPPAKSSRPSNNSCASGYRIDTYTTDPGGHKTPCSTPDELTRHGWPCFPVRAFHISEEETIDRLKKLHIHAHRRAPITSSIQMLIVPD